MAGLGVRVQRGAAEGDGEGEAAEQQQGRGRAPELVLARLAVRAEGDQGADDRDRDPGHDADEHPAPPRQAQRAGRRRARTAFLTTAPRRAGRCAGRAAARGRRGAGRPPRPPRRGRARPRIASAVSVSTQGSSSTTRSGSPAMASARLSRRKPSASRRAVRQPGDVGEPGGLDRGRARGGRGAAHAGRHPHRLVHAQARRRSRPLGAVAGPPARPGAARNVAEDPELAPVGHQAEDAAQQARLARAAPVRRPSAPRRAPGSARRPAPRARDRRGSGPRRPRPRSRPRGRWLPAEGRSPGEDDLEHLVAAALHVVLGHERLEVEAQERLGVGRADVEVPVVVVDRQAVDLGLAAVGVALAQALDGGGGVLDGRVDLARRCGTARGTRRSAPTAAARLVATISITSSAGMRPVSANEKSRK